jgi:hypothetical protein
MQYQRKSLQPLTQIHQESLGIRLVLKTRHDVVSVSHEENLPVGMALSPLMRPLVKAVMEIDVSERW